MFAPPAAVQAKISYAPPSAEELWRTYPLEQSPEPAKTLTPIASVRPTEPAPGLR